MSWLIIEKYVMHSSIYRVQEKMAMDGIQVSRQTLCALMVLLGVKIKPLVELNPRMTMGHIALRLEKWLAPGIEAEFRILSKAEWDEMKNVFAQIRLEKSADGRWQSGIVWLNEVDDHTKLIPLLLVGRSVAILSQLVPSANPGRKVRG